MWPCEIDISFRASSKADLLRGIDSLRRDIAMSTEAEIKRNYEPRKLHDDSATQPQPKGNQ